ncbi:MAG: hypothetical protein GY953_15100 [bacterium]|nr:hypothetical protein [bacterium]
MSLEVWIALFVGCAAIVEDLRSRQIPNWLTATALVGGVASQMFNSGWRGLGTAALGAAAGFGVFLVFYLLGGMGGGDVKLMAGFGALLGAGRLVQAALWTAMIGALLAVIVLGFGWLRARMRKGAADTELPKTIPYAPAIALGVWMALIPTG